MRSALPTVAIDAGELLHHVSRVTYRNSPLHFGRRATNRYDAPDRDYGVLYLGRDLATALMESVFHAHGWLQDHRRTVSIAEVHNRLVRVVGVLVDLRLANLTAEGVMASYFGLNLEQLAGRDYTLTQRISQRLHAMRDEDDVPLYDGILYPSRNNFPASSIAVFERAADKVTVVDDIDLADHVDWPPFVETFGISVHPDPGRP